MNFDCTPEKAGQGWFFDQEGHCYEDEKPGYRYLETLIDPGGRCIGREDRQRNQYQAEQHSQEILPCEENFSQFLHSFSARIDANTLP